MEKATHLNFPHQIREKLNAIRLLDAIQLNLRWIDDDGCKDQLELKLESIIKRIEQGNVYLTTLQIKNLIFAIKTSNIQKGFDRQFLNELSLSYSAILNYFGIDIYQQDYGLSEKKEESVTYNRKEGVSI